MRQVYEDTGVIQVRQKPPETTPGMKGLSIPLQPLVGTLMRIVQQTLNAAASSIMLSETKYNTLIFSFANGPIGERIRKLKISKQSGIAGWVVRNGQPLTVNDTSQSKYFNKFADNITGYTTNSIICVPMIADRQVTGVIEVLNKLEGGFDQADLDALTAVAAIVARIIEDVKRTDNTVVPHKTALKELAAAISARDAHLAEHSRRVARYALLGAAALELGREDRLVIEYASVLHDVGKTCLPDSILAQPGAPPEEAREMLRAHPATGFKMLQGIDFFQDVSMLVLGHHERYDGRGYPRELAGEAIHPGARLLAVADAFDHLTAGNSHGPALGEKEAFLELRRQAGSRFDPAAVKALYNGFVSALPA